MIVKASVSPLGTGVRVWSAPVRVNPGSTRDNLDHYNPSVAVHRDGTVDVVWRQRQETTGSDVDTYSRDVNMYLARSHDHGLHFGTPLKVDLSPSDVRFGAFSRGGLFQGDYDQAATSGGLTYVVRCESYAPNAKTVAPATPNATTAHHQTTWVAVIGTATTTTKVTPPVTTPVTAPVTAPGTAPVAKPAGGGALASTGGRPALALAGAGLVGSALLLRRRQGSRTRIQTSR